MYKEYAEHKKAYTEAKSGKNLENNQLALVQEHQYNPPSMF